MMGLEAIKTAMSEGNYALARRLRAELYLDIIHDLTDPDTWQSSSPPREVTRLCDAAEALDIPEEG
jgi:hypothetical protein